MNIQFQDYLNKALIGDKQPIRDKQSIVDKETSREKGVSKKLILPVMGGFLLALLGCAESDNNSDGGIVGTGSHLEAYLKNGMAAHNNSPARCDVCFAEIADDAATDSGAEASDDFSQTNVQEQGVDELDWLKTDGDLVYSYNGGETINIFNLSDNVGEASPVNDISLGSEWYHLRGLYLDGDTNESSTRLLAVADEYTYSYSEYFWNWRSSQAKIEIFDVSQAPETVTLGTTIEIDGQYVSSRKIGSKLYVMSQFTSYIDGYELYPYTDDQVSNNLSIINETPLEDLLPNITINGESQTLVQEDDCHIPGVPEQSTQPTLAILTEIDLANNNSIKAVCVGAPVTTIYASTNAVYFVEDNVNWNVITSDVTVSADSSGPEYSSTIYRLGLTDNGPAYTGNVSLDGIVGWDNQFRLSEYDQHLRVMTTQRQFDPRFLHSLHTINIGSDGLMSLDASIPNSTRTESIGKPNEDIYGIRFSGDRAYVVTFEQIDPFYVIDISNPSDPFVAGELELPGFSNYLHPFGDDLVFGLGRGEDNGEGLNSIKASLFDVSQPSNPSLLGEFFVEGDWSYSAALYSHTALSILPGTDDTSWQLGFSASSYEQSTWGSRGGWQEDAYYLFNINSHEHDQGAGIELAGKIVGSSASDSEANAGYSYSYFDRGVLTREHVYYSHNGELITRLWSDLY